jgi:hypothetical protein
VLFAARQHRVPPPSPPPLLTEYNARRKHISASEVNEPKESDVCPSVRPSLSGCTAHCKRAGRQVCTLGSSVDLSMMLSRRRPPARPPSPAQPSPPCPCPIRRFAITRPADAAHMWATSVGGSGGGRSGLAVFKSALNIRIFSQLSRAQPPRAPTLFVTWRFFALATNGPADHRHAAILSFRRTR